MKAFLQHNESGLYYKEGQWVEDVAEARAFSTVEEAEGFQRARDLGATHPVERLEPDLVARFLAVPPGQYQAGE